MKKFSQKSAKNKILTIIGLFVLAFIAYIAYMMISFSISSNTEKSAYEKTATTFEKLSVALNNIDSGYTWKNNNSCINTNNYALGSPDYSCTSRISLSFDTSDPKQFLDLHKKFYSVINNFPGIISKNNYKEYPVVDMGKKLVDSLAEQNYMSEGISCLYDAQLYPPSGTTESSIPQYGKQIEGGKATAQYEIFCSGKTMGAWYQMSDKR